MTRPSTTFSKKMRLFSPSVTRHLSDYNASIVNVTSDNTSGSSLSVSSSFRYDPIGSPLRSTQQLSIDWADFSRHTFFNSAESKVNIAFDKIINGYPFDGDKEEYIEFVDSLTGFEKYVLDSFPTNKGFINLGGVTPEGLLQNSHIRIKDVAGSKVPEISRDRSGNSILDPGNGSLTFEFFIRPAFGADYAVEGNVISLPSGNRAIVQRLSAAGTNGFGLYLLSGTNENSNETFQMVVSSGTLHISASVDIEKDRWTHLSCQLNRTPGINKIQLYKDGKLASTSSIAEIGTFNYLDQDLTIGVGRNHTFYGGPEQPANITIDVSQTLSGSIDEFRLFHSPRSLRTVNEEISKNIFAKNGLKLYFKFNEPHGSHPNANLVLDHSGHSMHSTIENYSLTSRSAPGTNSPLSMEEERLSPILFPAFEGLVDLNANLLNSASIYDVNNPNLITKLVPEHYLRDAALFEGLDADRRSGNAGDPYDYEKNMPGGGKMGSPQVVASLLFMWAKYFDELKLYLDQFGKLMNVDVIEEGSIADNFLPFVADYYGFTLPRIVDNTSIEQLIENESLTSNQKNSKKPLKKIQYIIWRRILADINEIIASKGTIHSVKSLMRNMGINPDNNFRFKEFGGARTRRITDSRQAKSAVYGMLDMSGSYASSGVGNAQGVIEDAPLVTSNFLATLRNETNEPGYPYIDAAGSDEQNGLLTSGSWTFEAFYKFQNPGRSRVLHSVTQSLARICTTGSFEENLIVANLVAISGSLDLDTTGSLTLFVRPQPNLPLLEMPLTGVDIFDGNKWYISFGRQRNDEIGNEKSSAYFLRAARASSTRLISYISTSSIFNDHDDTQINFFEKIDDDYNRSGCFIAIGKQQLDSSYDDGYGYTSGIGAINDDDVGNEFNCSTIFGGKIARIRFWSKATSEKEAQEHALNVNSLGVFDPKINFNFISKNEGSFGRLRIDASIDQSITSSNTSGEIELFDYSQNIFHMSGSGFNSDKRVIKPEPFSYSILSPHFEAAIQSNKVRVRSFLSHENIEKFEALPAPAYYIPADEKPVDDTRFSIEVSLVQALNEDMINLFSTLDTFDNIIGDPTAQFSEDYPDLTFISDVYFKRLGGKVNAAKFFEFFKWFDTSIGDTVEALLPRKTKFLGANFVIEPHVLERAKFAYNNYDIYVGPNDRFGLKGQILLQQFIAEILRY